MSSSIIGADYPFEYLHNEIVATLFTEADKSNTASTQNGKVTLNAETKLEQMGYRVGSALIERITKDVPRFATELDTMKFICKEFWTCVFHKQVDNLKTNHQGVYAILDTRFMLVASLSAGSTQYIQQATRQCAFACGLVRGALCNLRMPCIVTAAVDQPPAVRFSIQVHARTAQHTHNA